MLSGSLAGWLGDVDAADALTRELLALDLQRTRCAMPRRR